MSRLQRVITTVEDTRDVERAAVLMKSVARATPDRGRASMMYGSQRGLRLHGAWGLVAGVVAWNVVNLRAETLAVPYLDDSSLHEQMVRFATGQLEAGHLPLTGWFPYLGLGSPQFLHYQSLPR